MVFESLLVDIINRYLKPYVKKIDSSNLNIGVWNGNVHLKQLELKEDVLSEVNLRLPVTIGASYVEEVSLKVPWKKLARDPTVVNVSGVYLVLAPNTAGTYDYAKDKRREKAAKQKKLKELEEARKKSSKDKDKDEDSFLLKMASHIVKNLLVKVQDIHIRFEDSVTVPGRTFAAGITLDTLEVKTTTSSWVETVVKEAVTYAYKLVELNSLAVYFDPNAQPVLTLPQSSLVATLKEGICTKTRKVDHCYVLRPLTVYAKVHLNLRPEADLKTPQVSVAVECQQVDLDFSKTQYVRVLAVSQAMDMYVTRLKYVKHRPRVPLQGNIRLWWKFAYNSVVDEQVKPKLEAWSWIHMKRHRDYCRLYTKKYLEKLKSVHVSSSLEKELEGLEDMLDVFNIMLCRQLARQEKRAKKEKRGKDKGSVSHPLRGSSEPSDKDALQTPERAVIMNESPGVKTRGLPPVFEGGGERLVVGDKRKAKKEKGFFNKLKDKVKHGSRKKDVKSSKAVASRVVPGDDRAGAEGGEDDEEEEEPLSKKELELLRREEEERKRFLEDIGYAEGVVEVEFPPDYVGHKVTFLVEKVNLRVTSGDEQILHASVMGIEGQVDNRPSSGNLCVTTSVNSFRVLGIPTNDGQDTLLVTSEVGDLRGPLLSVSVEKSPLDKSADLRVCVNALPVKIIYEADTVDALIGAFKVQNVIHFRELTDAATATASELRVKAKKRLEVAIRQRKLLDIAVTWQSPYVIIPQNGTMSTDANLIVVSLGHLLVTSERQTEPSRSSESASLKSASDSLSTEFGAYYDTFKVELTGLQALVLPASVDWLKACQEKCSPYHIVPSTGVDLVLQRSILQKDAFLPSMQLSGTVHKVPVVLREDQLVLLLQIVLSLPLPPPSLVTKKEAVYSNLPASNRPTSPTVTQVHTALDSLYPISPKDTSDSDSITSSEMATGTILKATLPDTLRQLSDSSSTLGDLAGNLNVSQVIFTQLLMKLTVEEVSLDLKKRGDDGEVREFLHAEVKTITVDLTERTWDRQGTLRIESVDLIDYCTKDKDDGPVQVVQTERGGDGNFATVAFTMVDSVLGKEFAEKYTGLSNSATALLSRLNVSLHSGTMALLLELLTSLLPAVRQRKLLTELPTDQPDGPVAAVTAATASTAHSSSPMDFKLEVEFSGVHVEVSTQKEVVTCVDVQGLNVSGVVGRKAATVDATVNSLCVLGAAQKGAELQKMVFSEDEKMQLASIHLTKFNQSRVMSSADVPPDLTKLDVEVVVAVHKLRVMVLQAVVERAMDFVADVHIDKLLNNPDFAALMDSAAQAAAERSSHSPQQTIMPVQESPRKPICIKASLNLSAPVIILPTALSGGLVLDLGKVSFSAVPEHNEQSTVASLVGHVQLSAAQLYTVSDVSRWSDPKVQKQNVMQPLHGQAQLSWAMWKRSSHIEVPTLSVTGDMDKLQVTLTLDVINNVLATLEKTVALVNSPSIESIKQAVTSSAKKASGQGAEALKNVINKGGKVKREEPLSVDIDVSLSSGQLVLKTSEQEAIMFSGAISGFDLHTHILMKSNLPQVDMRITLTDLYILDHERAPPTKVVSSRRRSEKMLEVEISVVTHVVAAPRESAEMTIPPAIASIKTRVLPLQVYFTPGMALRLLDFVKNVKVPKIAVAKAVTITKEATTAAARLARDQHVDLDIVVEAPLICIPLSLPKQALVVNMGVLTLKNQCVKETYKVKGSREREEHTIESVFEHFTIALDDFSISRSVGVAHTSPEQSFVLEFLQSRTLWHPVHIKCTITRHMCYWMKEVPQLMASLHLGSLHLSIGTEDLDIMLEFGLDTAQRVKTAKLLPLKRTSDKVDHAEQSSAGKVAVEQTDSGDSTVDKSLLFNGEFQLDSFMFDLYCGEPSLENDASGAYPTEFCFTRLTIYKIRLDIGVTNSLQLDLNAFLQSFEVTDCRPKVQGRPMGNLMIRRYHDPSETQAQNRPLLSVSVTRFDDSNYLMVKANGLLVVLDVDFIKSLVDIMMELLHKDDKIGRLTALGKSPEPEVTQTCSLETEEVVYSEPPPSTKQAVQKKDTFKFHASLQNFRVAIVEDATKSNPTALLLRAETFAHLQFDLQKNSLRASLQLSNFGVSACSVLEMDNPMTHVLLPVSVSASLFGTADLQSVEVQVEVPSVSLSISPALVQLIQRVVKTFMPQKEEKKEILPPPADLWDVKEVQKTSWFLLSRFRETKIPPKMKAKKDERMEIHVNQVEVKMEGDSARPLVAIIARASGSVTNWSTELTTEFTIQSEVTYYNEALSLWEPILEPVAIQRGKYQPWNFQVQFKMPIAGEYEYVLGSKKTDKTIVERFRSEPKFVVDVSAKSPLELTVTHSAVNLVKSMVEAYTADVTVSSEFSSTAGFKNVSSAPVTVYNKIGKEYEVAIKPGPSFKVDVSQAGEAKEDSFIVVPYCSNLDFSLSPSRAIRSHKSVCSTISAGLSVTRDSFDLRVPHHEVVRDIGVVNDGVFCYPLIPQDVVHREDTIPLVIQVRSAYGKKLVTVRSSYQVVNHLNVELDLYMSKETSTLKQLAVLQPGEAFPFPLAAVLHNESFSVAPHGFGFVIDPSHVKISETQETMDLMCCAPQTGSIFFVRVVPEEEEYADQYEWVPASGKSHTFHIRPPILIHNLLPYPVDITYEGVSISTRIEPGKSEPLCQVPTSKDNTLHVKVKTKDQVSLGGHIYLGPLSKPQECIVQPDLRQSGLQVHHDPEQTSYYNLYLYAPVWVINKTGQDLCYSVSRSKNGYMHLADESNILFLPEADESSTVKVCIDHCAGSESSSWSKSISLKAVPSQGNVSVKQFGGEYEVKLGIHLALAKIQLTRVLTITPYYMLSNQTQELIYIQEEGSPFAALQIQSGETMPFPVVTNSLKVQMAIQTPSTWSKLFSFSKSHATILKLEGQIKAVIVNVEASEGICTIAFSPYYPGCTPVRVANLFRATFLEFQQAQNKNERKTFLAPGEALEYTWSDPTGKRFIYWTLSNTGIAFAINTSKDGSGTFALPAEALPPHQLEDSDSECEDVDSEWLDIAMDGSIYLSGQAERGKQSVAAGKPKEKRESKGYWISFLDGLQRTLLFTDRYNLIENVRRRGRTSSSLVVANATFRSIGVSVVDDIKKRDILYLGLKESELIWQLRQRDSTKWKTVDEGLRGKLETAYKEDPKAVLKEDELHVNLESMEMLHPVSGVLRRTRHGGLDLEVKVARDLKEFAGHIKSGYIQADNQLPVSLYPIVLQPIPPPPSVGSYALPPFAEAGVILRRTELSNLFLVKYLGAAVQNMSVGIDFSLVAALLAMVKLEGELDISGDYLEADRQKALVPLKSTVEAEVTSASTQLYIGNIEIAPVKAKLSFSAETIRYFPDLETKTVNTILGLFSTVTAFQDTDFKLSALHVGHEPSSAKKLIALIQKHYVSQSLFQVYAVILGLDVIGNPVSFVRGFTEGTIDLFYEPVKAGIHGDLGEGLLYGGKSFLGGTVGGVAGAGAKVTGSLGNVVAKLTFDKDHQESRIQDKGKQDSSILHRFGGLGKSLFKGVTGVVTQPVKGAKQEGAVGVVKGIGRGTAGFLLKPIGGIIDFTSSNLTSLKNTTSVYTTDVERLRQPRFISGSGLRPYSAHDAAGLAIFNRVTQGDVDTKEALFAHEELGKGTVVLLTNRRVVIAEHTSVIDHWRVTQEIDFTKMTDMPVVQQNAVIIYFESGGAVQQMDVKPLRDAEVAVNLGDIIGKVYLRTRTVQ